MTGFARTLRMENSQLELYTLDLSSEGDAASSNIYHVLERIHYSHGDPISKLDYEVAEKDGQLWTCRLVKDSGLEDAYGPARKMNVPAMEMSQAPHHLVVREPGILESLAMAQDDEYSALPDGHVLVDVKAIGLDERVSTTASLLSTIIVISNSDVGWTNCTRSSSCVGVWSRMLWCCQELCC